MNKVKLKLDLLNQSAKIQLVMNARRFLLTLAILLWSAGLVWAAAPAIIKPDQWTAWLDRTDLKLERTPAGQRVTLYSFSSEADAFDLAIDNSRYYLAYELAGSIFFTSSIDNGLTFISPEAVAAGQTPALAVKNRTIWLAWSADNAIKLIKSEDAGQTFGQTITASLTNEALSSPELLLDDHDRLHLAFLSLDPDTHQNTVNYQSISFSNNQLVSSETRPLFSGHDALVNLKIQEPDNILVSWQMEYFERRQSYLCVSLNSGANFSGPRELAFEQDLLALKFIDKKLTALTFNDRVIARELELPVLAPPQILSIANGRLNYALTGDPPLLCSIELDGQVFEELILSRTLESRVFALPADLSDGVHSLRLRAFDGLSASQFSQAVAFTVDTIPPGFITFESERVLDRLTYQGQADGSPASLSLNNDPISLEADNSFAGQLALEAGNNLFNFILSDESGNSSVLTLEVFYNPASPEITVLTPTAADWFKPGSNIIIEAEVHDLQGDIEDGAEARLQINDQLIEDVLVFDQAENGLFGFVALPESLSDGQHSLVISLKDRNNNTGSAKMTLNIDGNPPELTVQPDGRQFSNAGNSSTLPLIDQGAGLDLSGTLITIDQMTLEGSVSQEGAELILCCSSALSEGSHEVEILPRDLVGNIGDSAAYFLIIDTVPPLITLTGTYENTTTQNKVLIKGTVLDQYPGSIRILNNRVETNNAPLNSADFAVEVRLKQGSNDIQVEAADLAGNKTTENIRLFCTAQHSTQLISSFMHGPNPFSPARDLPGAFSTHGKGMIFAYSLAQPAEIKIRIYDITGTLIWVRTVNSATSGVTAWSGQDQFGQISPNGIYPYFFSATGGGRTETRRGKIIINQ